MIKKQIHIHDVTGQHNPGEYTITYTDTDGQRKTSNITALCCVGETFTNSEDETFFQIFFEETTVKPNEK